MKRTFLMFLATALVVSLLAAPSQAIKLKVPGICITPQCCEEPQCCEPQACEPECCKPKCPSCGNCSCMVVCEMKKVKKTVWVVEYEKFAPVNPGCNLLDVLKSKLDACTKNGCCDTGCCEPEACCEESCCDDGCCKKCVPPQCGKVRCKKKLIKKEITKEVPVYKCVVTGCKTCCDDGDSAPVENPAKQPKAAPAPKPEKEEAPVARLRVPVFERY